MTLRVLDSAAPNNPVMLTTFTGHAAFLNSAYTRTSAYAEFSEKDKGTREPEKLADLAVLSQDIFTVPPVHLFFEGEDEHTVTGRAKAAPGALRRE